jgi:HK97 family phage portal protein
VLADGGRHDFDLLNAGELGTVTPYTQIICGNNGDALEVTNATSGNTRPADWFLRWATGDNPSDAGVTVNGYTALTHCPLWQGVNIISGDIGQVPIRLVKNEFFDQKEHNAWQLLRVRPNELQSPSVWKETMIQWALIWGNGVSWIRRAGSRPVDLIPLRPDCLWPELIAFDEGQVLLYHYISLSTGKNYTFFPDDVIHIQGLTGDGVWGYPLHEIAKNTIGQGLALERHGNKQFANGARPSGVLEHPAKLPDDARANLRREWELIHGGPDNAGRIAILWEGMKFNATSMTNIDAQWIEAKKLDRVNAASLLNLPAHKLNALEDSSVRSNLEEQNEVYKQMTLTRWSNRMDEEFRRKLLTDKEWKSDEYQFVFDWDTFLRADIDTLTQVGDRCVKGEIMNRNEARKLIRLPPYPGGDKFGSPAINPQTDEKKEAEEPPKPAPKTPQNRISNVSNAHRELLLDRLLHFIERESMSLKQAASGAKNFVKWLDEFYGGDVSTNGSEPKIVGLSNTILGSSVRACLAAGLDARGIAISVARYAENRHAQLLEACSTVTKAELPAVIEKLTGEDRTLVAQGLLATALGSQETELSFTRREDMQWD